MVFFWLILLAMGLWGGMPDAYATALPGLYLPLLVMIFGLIFRGFAIEMALQRPGAGRTWMRLFGAGSLAAALAQGVASVPGCAPPLLAARPRSRSRGLTATMEHRCRREPARRKLTRRGSRPGRLITVAASPVPVIVDRSPRKTGGKCPR